MGQPAKKIEHPYITQINDICGGEPIIVNTRTPVRSIVVYLTSYRINATNVPTKSNTFHNINVSISHLQLFNV